MDYLDIAGIARQLGIPWFRARRLCRLPGFPAPTDQDGREVWSQTQVLRWAAAAGGELALRAPRLYQQVPPGEAAIYHGGTARDGLVVLR
jgi:hypothetical protein